MPVCPDNTFCINLVHAPVVNEEIQQKKKRENSKYVYVVLNFCALDFLVGKIKEWEFQKVFYHSLPYFYTYPG